MPVGRKIFRAPPDPPWDPPSLLYNGYRVIFPGVKRSIRGFDHLPLCSAEVKEGVVITQLHLWAFVACSGIWNSPGTNRYSVSDFRAALKAFNSVRVQGNTGAMCDRTIILRATSRGSEYGQVADFSEK
jgi:hypothetical protein